MVSFRYECGRAKPDHRHEIYERGGNVPYETQVANYIERTGCSVLYKVTPDFRDNELVARGVRIQAQSVDGKDGELAFDIYCYNVQPGYAIDYLTGAASKD